MITIEVNEHTQAGKAFLELARLFSKSKEGVRVIESPYDPDFVKKIKTRERDALDQDLTPVDPEKVWESIL